MIVVRTGGEEILLEPEEWQRWVEDGRVPPDAWVKFPDREWARAGSLPGFRAPGPGLPPEPTSTAPSLREVIFPRRGISATELLLLVNLAVAAVLTAALGRGYEAGIRNWTAGWWYAVSGDHAYGWWIPTLFLHAGFRHLASNMLALLVTAGAVEFLTGRTWTFLLYLLTGVAGMAVSFWGHGQPPLSVGASGAIYGLAGAAIGLVVRRRGHFTRRQQWKTRRVYVPLFLALALPSLLQADYWGHTGGLLAGLLLGPFVPPHHRVKELGTGESSAGI